MCAGDISKAVDSDLDRYTTYALTVVATDAGQGRRGSEVDVRIDTFDADDNIVMINMTLPLEDFMAVKDDFLLRMTQICSIKYQDCSVKMWRAQTLDGSKKVSSMGRSLLQADKYVNMILFLTQPGNELFID